MAVIIALVYVIVLVTFTLISAMFCVWLERKVSGRLQDRLGPTRVGGKFGWLQTIADGLKLLTKEDLVPAGADRPLFLLAPYIAYVGAFAAFIALPFGDGLVAQHLDISIFFILAVMSLEVFGVILAGYASGSKWSLFGGMREAAQVVSYEVPMALCLVLPVMAAGTLNMHQIALQQGGWFTNWIAFHDPFTFLSLFAYFTCATASVKRAPFDLAEAESELVAGFHTEYSGFRWLFFFTAEYASMITVSGIASIMYLGGWHTGLRFEEALAGIPVLPQVVQVIVFLIKCYLGVFVMMWARWTLPRLRIDQVMKTCLKFLLPITCALLLGASVWAWMLPKGLF